MIPARPDNLESLAISRQYFILPRRYADALGGLRWSDSSDFLVLPRDHPVVAQEGLAEFLEGFASQRSLLAFGSMAHWAILFNTTSADSQFERLRTAFRAQGSPWRNAGALAGMMSEPFVPAVEAPPVEALCSRLRERAFPIRWFTDSMNGVFNEGDEPAHSLVEFEQHVRLGLGVLSDADLAAWLTTGRGPVRRAGDALARERPPPRSLANVFDALFERPRLAGARAHLTQMITALAVPPRRRTREQLPLGGYVDVVTHGSIDRLLPSQHVLDDLEFLRRFSENELLYFRREEPPARQAQELVVVLDQGIRAWGDVRLVLTAAALALTHYADRKKMACRLALTSRPGVWSNPLEELAALGPALEASDFTRQPGLALEGVLEGASPIPRDVVLLTHPFSLREPDVQAAARRLLPQDRLFALTVNGAGEAELAQLQRGLPVRLRSFRVDFAPATTVAAKPPVQSASIWTGDVEALPWPFRFGTDSPLRLFDFDASGRRFLVVTESSMLYHWNLDTGDLEILPRPLASASRTAGWHDLIGVEAGFALQAVQGSHHIVAHYDMEHRRCTLHETSIVSKTPAYLAYVRNLHTVVLMHHRHHRALLAIDLATGQRASGAFGRGFEITIEVSASTPPQQIQSRAERAIQRMESGGAESQVVVPVHDLSHLVGLPFRTYAFDSKRTALTVFDGTSAWPAIAPHTEGKPTFARAQIDAVRLAGTTLAVAYRPGQSPAAQRLMFFRGPKGDFIREAHLASNSKSLRTFCLSPDGAKVALLQSDKNVEVQGTDRPQRILYTRAGGYGTQSRLWIGDGGVLLVCGRKGYAWHLIQWRQGVLEVHSEMKPSNRLAYEEFHHPRIRGFLRNADPAEATAEAIDIGRGQCRQGNLGGATFLLDRFGQILVLDANNNLVFQFFAHGDSWSAWMPDGTRHGHGMVHSWPNTPNALGAMGRALLKATGGRP